MTRTEALLREAAEHLDLFELTNGSARGLTRPNAVEDRAMRPSRRA